MQHQAAPAPTVERTVIEAIGRNRLLVANYNGSEMQLAPHQLFSRHGELFVSALNTSKNWRSDDDRRLGHFKISGLSNVSLTDASFEPLETYDNSLPREDDEHIFGVATS